MKKPLIILIFVFFLSIFIILPGGIFGYDSNDVERSYNDYVYSTSKYNQDLESFTLAKGKYQSFKTFSSEVEAIAATKKMLLSKIELVKNYLTFIRIKLAKETKIVDYRENLTFVQLDNKIVDILGLKEKVDSSQTLTDLERVEKDFGERFISAKKLSYKSIALINIRNFSENIKSFSKIIESLKEKISEINASFGFDIQPLQKRLEEIENEYNNKIDNFNLESNLILNKIDSQDDSEKDFSKFENFLFNFKSELLSFFPQLEEIIFLLKKYE